MNCELSYHQLPDGNVRVDAKMNCGKSFEEVAVVVEPDSPNPGLSLSHTLGFNAVQTILTHVYATKASFDAACEARVDRWLPAWMIPAPAN